jgi:hypothetical protein
MCTFLENTWSGLKFIQCSKFSKHHILSLRFRPKKSEFHLKRVNRGTRIGGLKSILRAVKTQSHKILLPRRQTNLSLMGGHQIMQLYIFFIYLFRIWTLVTSFHKEIKFNIICIRHAVHVILNYPAITSQKVRLRPFCTEISSLVVLIISVWSFNKICSILYMENRSRRKLTIPIGISNQQEITYIMEFRRSPLDFYFIYF